MEYLTLQKFGYRFPTQLTQEIHTRKNSPSTVTLHFDQGQYFYVLTPELLRLSEEIWTNEHHIIPHLSHALPTRTYQWLLRSLYATEIQATHEIEGIHSTRKEAELAINSDGTKTERFSEFFKILSLVVTGTHNATITTIEAIRDLYDNVTAGEIEQENALDGKIFRQQPVHVFSDAQKILHTGFQPETKIIQGLHDMLAEATHPSVSRLTSAILCHFMFETIHPFYDGNGRTGRVLLAYHLSHDLHPATLLSLSQAISADKRAYYESLRSARDPRNHGELTHFVTTMLEFIISAQNRVIEKLQHISHQLRVLDSRLPHIKMTGTQTQEDLARRVAALLAQHYAFGQVLGVSLDTLIAEIDTRVSRRTLAAVCDALVEHGLVDEKKRRPRMFTLSDSGADLLGIKVIPY